MEQLNKSTEFVFNPNDVTVENLKGKSIFCATPMYGGQCNVNYTRAILDLTIKATANNIPLRFYFVANESLITRARNYCVASFLETDCTHMMFIDADIGFDATDVFSLLYITDHDKGRGIVGGLYPKKNIAWEKVAAAVMQGYGKTNPSELAQFAGDLVFNQPELKSITTNMPFEVCELGTGFMMIDRKVFTDYTAKYPERIFTPDHIRDDQFNGSKRITAFFDTYICAKSNRYLSEDYAFCRECAAIGVKIWACPWIKLTHLGAHTFQGDMISMLTIGASATVDPSKLRKTTPLAKAKRNKRR